MDRLYQLRGEGRTAKDDEQGSDDSTLDITSSQCDAFMTANESSSKYFSLSEVDSTFDISPIKDVSLASSATDAERTITGTDGLISNLPAIGNKDDLLGYKIGKQIEAANILSGGVDIFDDNENSYDGNELVIDDNVSMETDDKSNTELKLPETVELPFQKAGDNIIETTLVDSDTAVASKDTEVVLHIDGKNVDAIDIGNGLYLYRKEGHEELAAIQIIDDDQQQPSFKFLKVRENSEGNLEVYEEIEVEVPKEVPAKEGTYEKKSSHVPIKDINKLISDPALNKIADGKIKIQIDESGHSVTNESNVTPAKELDKTEINFNSKMTKLNEARKSPVIGSYTPMTFHSTPNKEGIPLTKTMVDLQLQPSRHSDNVKKTIEVHTNTKCISDNKIIEGEKDNEEESISVEETQEIKELSNNDRKKDEISVDLKSDTSDKQFHNIIQNKSENINMNDELIPNTLKNSVSENLKAEVENSHQNKGSEAVIEKLQSVANDINKTPITEAVSEKPNETKIQTQIERKPEISSIIPKESAKLIDNINDKSDNRKTIAKTLENIQSEELVQLNKQETKTEITNVDKVVTEISYNAEKQLKNGDTSSIDQAQQKETTKVISKDLLKNETKEILQDRSKEIQTKQNNLALIDTRINDGLNKQIIKSDSESKSSIVTKYIVENPKEAKIDDNAKINSCSNKKIVKHLTSQKECILKKVETVKNTETKNIKEDTPPIINSNETAKSLITISKPEPKKDVPKISINISQVKSIKNTHIAVPFGKWTEANRQEFLNKIKETKTSSVGPNAQQIKHSNDLNRRDVLKKIDSQRQSNIATARIHELNSKQKLGLKLEPTFTNKTVLNQTTKPQIKINTQDEKHKPHIEKHIQKLETHKKELATSTSSTVTRKEISQRKEINNQDLIDKTIEDIINRNPPKVTQEQKTQGSEKETTSNQKSSSTHLKDTLSHLEASTLDAIEMKMNELHGIPFVERHPHELPQVYNQDTGSINTQNQDKAQKANKVPELLPFTNKQKLKENLIEVDSEDEIIEHEPITGDIAVNKPLTSSVTKDVNLPENLVNSDTTNKLGTETIITENEFDKFVRRNSITYENCLTVNFDGTEPHNVVKTVIEKDVSVKEPVENDSVLQTKSKSQKVHQDSNKNAPLDTFNKNYHSKVQRAYQSVLTAKRQMEGPVTIIEDKPVKVVFMDSNAEYVSVQMPAQTQELLPNVKIPLEQEISDTGDYGKSLDYKGKGKHQRKQVLTPVETPELELIEPSDLGIEVSPKKKRKCEDKNEKNSKNVVPKKSYLLGRSIGSANDASKTQDCENPPKETINQNHNFMSNLGTASAIDNLVKAAELLENQAINSDEQQNTPVKRGRGRPRKYPIPIEGITDKQKIPSPQKKPRLIDDRIRKPTNGTDEEHSSDEDIIKENWTMGKINENIVCPICNKLFRSENVVFKHVKHCTGPSPNRSDSDNRSSIMSRISQESCDSKSDDMDVDFNQKLSQRVSPKKRKSKDKSCITTDDEDSALIKFSKSETGDQKKQVKIKSHNQNNLICEFCGKTFRQLSYLANHKLQHKEGVKISQSMNNQGSNKTVLSCEVCKKQFRKLHHLVQHRIIHNPSSTVSSRPHRKSSSEHTEHKISKNSLNENEDQSAGFRCEPCDKSFRKLHHLVEHRETHDGINRQKNTPVVQPAIEKPPPQCDVCKKTFRKLHHLIEHKEQHLETSSEKSDDRSVKSSLSTKDIIHECSLCYMVFPNEHSLNKHTVICQRKKKQSAAKQAEKQDKTEILEENIVVSILEKNDNLTDEDNEPEPLVETPQTEEKESFQPKILDIDLNKNTVKEELSVETVKKDKAAITIETTAVDIKNNITETQKSEIVKEISDIAPKELIESEDEKIIKIKETLKGQTVSKNKIIGKDKIAPTVTKRQNNTGSPIPVVQYPKPVKIDSSDEDEIRYMLNPEFNTNEAEGKFIKKLRTEKRNSLDFQQTKSRELIKRRSLQQHPPKIPRLKPKLAETKVVTTTTTFLKSSAKPQKSEQISYTDSDDSDVKYSFPKNLKPKKNLLNSKLINIETNDKKSHKLPLSEKRKSLSGIAKRKSLGRPPLTKAKVTPKSKPTPTKQNKRRLEAEHRCDCGQLFSSAALLSRHTTLAHTPPRIRRRRSPPPDVDKKPVIKPASRKSSLAEKSKPSPTSRKSSVKSDVSNTTSRKSSIKSDTNKPAMTTRKSRASNTEEKDKEPHKSIKSETMKSGTKSSRLWRTAHRGVPVPEKMRKMMEELKK